MCAAAVAAVVASPVGAAGARAGALLSGSCHPSGRVLVKRDGVVIWVRNPGSQNRERVYLCALRSGTTHLLYPGPKWVVDSGPTPVRVTYLKRAGNFVGFFLSVGGQQGGRVLFVFNAVRGTMELNDFAYCGGNDECTGPWLTRYQLAPNGWVAEKWSDLPIFGNGLLATNGGKHHYELDIANVSHMSVSRGTLRWDSSYSGPSSVKLGRDVITPASPRKLTACQLLRRADLAIIFPRGETSSSSPGECTYTSKTDASKVLTVKLRTGMSPKQQKAAEQALLESWERPYGVWWPQDDDFFVADNPTASGHLPFAVIVNGAEVQLDVTKPKSVAPTQLGHLSVVAVDRLFGVPIKRAR